MTRDPEVIRGVFGKGGNRIVGVGAHGMKKRRYEEGDRAGNRSDGAQSREVLG